MLSYEQIFLLKISCVNTIKAITKNNGKSHENNGYKCKQRAEHTAHTHKYIKYTRNIRNSSKSLLSSLHFWPFYTFFPRYHWTLHLQSEKQKIRFALWLLHFSKLRAFAHIFNPTLPTSPTSAAASLFASLLPPAYLFSVNSSLDFLRVNSFGFI